MSALIARAGFAAFALGTSPTVYRAHDLKRDWVVAIHDRVVAIRVMREGTPAGKYIAFTLFCIKRVTQTGAGGLEPPTS